MCLCGVGTEPGHGAYVDVGLLDTVCGGVLKTERME